MSDPVNFPTPHAVAVDWDAPHLQKLLKRVASWQLDQRGGYAPQIVRLFIGWTTLTSRPGCLVWQDEAALVLQTDFPLSVGERIRVERPHVAQGIWGEVVQSRPGQRPGDAEQGVWIHWVRVHSQRH